MFWWLVLLTIAGGVALGVGQIIKSNQTKKSLLKQAETDERLKNAKLFDGATGYFVLISESGFLGLKTPQMTEPKIVHIKDINGFELRQNGHSAANASSAAVGGLLFGGVGALVGGIGSAKEKITSISFVFKINDFNIPSIEIKFLDGSTKSDSFYYDAVMQKINELDGLLSFIEKKYRNAN